MEFLWSDSHFLTEQFSQLSADQAIVASEGAGLGTSAGRGCTDRPVPRVGPWSASSVQYRLPSVLRGSCPCFLIYLLISLRSTPALKGRPIDLLFSTGDINWTGITTSLAPDTASKRLNQRLPEGPVVVLREQLPKAVKETLDELSSSSLFLGLGRVRAETPSRAHS